MQRLLLQSLLQWKAKVDRKPLIIRGARQVGKTWLMKEFGKNNYNNIAYVNFETARSLHSVFETGFEVDKLIMAIKIETGAQISPGATLIILDEIQECEAALTALKYFQENANQYHIIAQKNDKDKDEFEMYNADKIDRQEFNKVINKIIK